MNTNELREHLLTRAPWVDRQRTVDTVKAGDPTKEIHCVGVGWMSSLESLREAIRLGCGLFITHEPTFWEHSPEESALRDTEPGLSKQRFLDETGLVVLRVHDIWDNWPGLGIRDQWARGLGLDDFVAEDETRWHALYAVRPTSLVEFAQQMADRVAVLGQDSISVMGDPNRVVSRVAVGVGCGGPDKDMVDVGADVLIVCYDGASYWRARERLFELGAAIITVEHGTSEMWGLRGLSRYLRETFSDLTVYDIDRHPKPWTIVGAPREE